VERCSSEDDQAISDGGTLALALYNAICTPWAWGARLTLLLYLRTISRGYTAVLYLPGLKTLCCACARDTNGVVCCIIASTERYL